MKRATAKEPEDARRVARLLERRTQPDADLVEVPLPAPSVGKACGGTAPARRR